MQKGFWLGFLVGSIIVASGMGYLLYKLEQEPLRFPSFMAVNGNVYYSFSGSIVGDDKKDGPVNNYIDVTCWKERMECDVLTQIALTSKSVGPISNDVFKVRKWDDRELIFDSDGSFAGQCNWYEVHANLKTDEVTYTRIPNKSADPVLCQGSERKVFKWKIANGPAWQSQAFTK